MRRNLKGKGRALPQAEEAELTDPMDTDAEDDPSTNRGSQIRRRPPKRRRIASSSFDHSISGTPPVVSFARPFAYPSVEVTDSGPEPETKTEPEPEPETRTEKESEKEKETETETEKDPETESEPEKEPEPEPGPEINRDADVEEWYTAPGAEFQMLELSDVAVSTWVDDSPDSPPLGSKQARFQSALYVSPAVGHLVNGTFCSPH